MEKVVAKVSILYNGKLHKPGDIIVDPDTEMVEAWKRAGSIIKENDVSYEKKNKAKRMVATPGIEVQESNSLIGKVPKEKNDF